jgi:Rieske Fe-S protein
MAVRAAPTPGTISRNRFMTGVFGGIFTVIGLVYIVEVLRYLYPKGGSDTPPLPVMLSADGVTPKSGTTLPWSNGVAGPFYYPMVANASVVVGMFVEQKVVNGRLTADNLRAVEQTCTHLGCPVAWVPNPTNPVEPAGRFECPCHGSQFHRNLSVAHGPAANPLHEHEFTLSGNIMTILKRKS